MRDPHCPHIDPSDQRRQDEVDDLPKIVNPDLKRLWDEETKRNEADALDEVPGRLPNGACPPMNIYGTNQAN